MKKLNSSVWAWALYDFGNSTFSTVVIAGFFPVFFKAYWSLGADVNLSTARLGFGASIASLLVALMAPILGSLSDISYSKKKFLLLFASLGILGTALLTQVNEGDWQKAILFYVLAIFGFMSANLFYDSLLVGLVKPERYHFVSSLGYSLGYLGGGLLFAINIYMTLNPELFGLTGKVDAVQASFLSVALWWGFFTLVLYAWVPEPRAASQNKNDAFPLIQGFVELKKTFAEIKNYRPVYLFLIAYWCYIDAVDTLVFMAVDYGMSIGFESTDLITALLIVQFVGFPMALVTAKTGEKWGVRRTLYITIFVYIVTCAYGTLLTAKHEFFILAGMIGCVQGGVQALSRSYYSQLIPPEKAGEFFGFYNMLGKFAAIVGPFLIGATGLVAKKLLTSGATGHTPAEIADIASRWGFGSLIFLLVLGAYLLSRVPKNTED